MADEFDDKNLKETLNAWRESVDRQAHRPDWFWARQRTRMTSRMKQPKLLRVPTLAWAGIAATVTIGVALMVPADTPLPSNPSVKSEPKIEAQVSDHELMLQLEDTMNSGVPDALQPASALAQELDQAYSSKVTGKTKESRQ